jgi:hypothetical protein
MIAFTTTCRLALAAAVAAVVAAGVGLIVTERRIADQLLPPELAPVRPSAPRPSLP